jgi:hypothetical protein
MAAPGNNGSGRLPHAPRARRADRPRGPRRRSHQRRPDRGARRRAWPTAPASSAT